MKALTSLTFLVVILGLAACNNEGGAGSPHHFAIQGTTTPPINTCVPYTVARLDDSDDPSPPARSITVLIGVQVGPAGAFADSGCTVPTANNVVMQSTDSTVNFWIKVTQASACVLNASSEDLPGDTKAVFNLTAS